MKLLLLAGSGEARQVASGLSQMPAVSAIASFAGATRKPASLDIPSRVGGFGGDAGFRDFLKSEAIDAVLDATHPFAARISDRTARICEETGTPHAQVLRPPWRPQNGDQWTFFNDESEVVKLVHPGDVVFLGTGPQGLANYSVLQDCRIICRRIDPPRNPFPFAGGEYLVGRPPFSSDEESALFRRLGVDLLVVKNSGGDGSRSKLDAARALGLRVALQNRPDSIAKIQLSSAEAALEWVRGVL